MQPTFTIRAATSSDHIDFVRYFAELRTSDRPASVERWVADMMPHTFFLEEQGRKVGYAFVEVFGDLGSIRHLVVDSSARGRGVGRALMSVIAERLRKARCKRWELNVKPDNLPAMRLYESVGMKKQHASSVVRIDWADALRMPFDAQLSGRDVDPAEDDDIERDLQLPDGKLLRLREMTGQLLVQLVDAQGHRLGFARFDPEFPGAFPFRVKSPRHAGDLLRALHVHRSPQLGWMQVVIEDGAETTKTLLAAGARPVFDILHLAGDIPAA